MKQYLYEIETNLYTFWNQASVFAMYKHKCTNWNVVLKKDTCRLDPFELKFNLRVKRLNMKNICVLLLILFQISGSSLGTLNLQLLKEGNSDTLCGTVHDISVRSLQACSLACLQQDMCKAVLFADDTAIPQNCKLVTTESETEIDSLDFSDYTQYFLTMNCTGFDNPNISFIPPLNWNSGCPVAY